jgi:hypothetical protein
MNQICHRIYNIAYDPIYFDRSKSGRFNASDGSFGVLYLARARAGAFAETFLRAPGRTLIPDDLVAKKGYISVQIGRDLVLANMTGKSLPRMGATSEITHGSLPYDAPQRWSTALHGHSQLFDGIVYTSRHDDEQHCYAIFERAEDAVIERKRSGLDGKWFDKLLDRYKIGISPS